jgi:hypothetical protein
MKTKLSLDLDTLAVETFATTPAEADARGTVRAHDDSEPTPPAYDDKCTCDYSCLCKTAYYHCGTGPHTIHSCHYTYNLSCYYTQACTPPDA